MSSTRDKTQSDPHSPPVSIKIKKLEENITEINKNVTRLLDIIPVVGELKSAYDSFNNENSLSEDEQIDEHRNVDPNLGPRLLNKQV